MEKDTSLIRLLCRSAEYYRSNAHVAGDLLLVFQIGVLAFDYFQSLFYGLRQYIFQQYYLAGPCGQFFASPGLLFQMERG